MILSIELYEENHIVENNQLFSFVYLSYNRVNGKGKTSCLNTPICARLVPKKTTVSNAANGVEVQNISHVFAVAAPAVLTAV